MPCRENEVKIHFSKSRILGFVAIQSKTVFFRIENPKISFSVLARLFPISFNVLLETIVGVIKSYQERFEKNALVKSRSTEKHEVIGPKAICIWSVLNFLRCFGCSFLDNVLLFWFLSKSYGFLDSNFNLFFWTGL